MRTLTARAVQPELRAIFIPQSPVLIIITIDAGRLDPLEPKNHFSRKHQIGCRCKLQDGSAGRERHTIPTIGYLKGVCSLLGACPTERGMLLKSGRLKTVNQQKSRP